MQPHQCSRDTSLQTALRLNATRFDAEMHQGLRNLGLNTSQKYGGWRNRYM
jgi:hypothetical protein